MARGSYLAGTIKSTILGAALAGGLAFPAFAADLYAPAPVEAAAPTHKLALSGSAVITTDYLFRGISQTSNSPAAQVEFDATYGIFYGYVWGSNVDFADSIELDYGLGITPKWGPVTFNVAGLAYTYPGFNDQLAYFELKTGASWTTGNWAWNVANYWSPNNFQAFGESDAIEGSLGYNFTNKLWNFFTPSISGGVGYQYYEKNADSYTYWNAGLTLGFLERWSADIRYWDTTYDGTQCLAQSGLRSACDARAVGTIKATF
jgi:uncharacterized protein (TIGR02001 family)